MGWLQVSRLIVLYSTSLFSLAILAISIHLLSLNQPSPICAALSLSASISTFFTLPVIIYLDYFRRGVHASPILVEISWLSLLGVLWLVASGVALSFAPGHASFCRAERTSCMEVTLVGGLSIASCILLISYASTLLLKSVLVCSTGPREQRPTRVWTATVKDNFRPPTSTSLMRSSYAASTLDIFAVKEGDDPFQRVPSIRISEATRSSMAHELDVVLSTTPSTPNSSSLLHSPGATSPLSSSFRPPTPMYPGHMGSSA
ncbi:hypothetical protein BDW22DRAFT_1211459 [Trametopsis cervina]|nr:hypothetical protein BDW22DRAFT_1211459 [Trametopsis cervina]